MANRIPVFLPERPLDDKELREQDGERLRPVIETLGSQLEAYLSALDKHRHGSEPIPEPLRIGLFGGLGQGKSTVMTQVISRIHERKITRRIFLARCNWIPKWLSTRKAYIHSFDASLFRADDLEGQFNTALLLRWLPWRGFVLLLLFLTPFIFLWPVLPAPWILTFVLVSSVVFPLFPKILSFLEKFGVQKLKQGTNDAWLQQLARHLPAGPEIVVIDDLDRAKIDQQKAVLRALYKHSQRFGFCLVVCLDEKEMLNAPRDPEAPEELLNKVIQTAHRMPSRTLEDSAVLTFILCRQYAQANSSSDYCNRLVDPLFMGDMARLTMLLGETNPRTLKRLLSDTLTMGQQLNIANTLTLSAIARLIVLYQIEPGARTSSEIVIGTLEENRISSIDKLSDIFSNDLVRREKLRVFLTRTRAMQPERTSWRSIFAQSISTPRTPLQSTIAWFEELERLIKESDHKYSLSNFLRHISKRLVKGFESIGNGYSSQDFTSELAALRKIGISASPPIVWPFFVAYAVSRQPYERCRLYTFFEQWLDIAAPHNNAWIDHAYFCLYREWLSDQEAWEQTPVNNQDRLVSIVCMKFKARRFSLLSLIEVNNDNFLDLLTKAVIHPDSNKGDFLTTRAWLSRITPRGKAGAIDISGLSEFGMAEFAWPFPPDNSFPLSELFQVAVSHVEALHLLAKHGVFLFPDAIRSFMVGPDAARLTSLEWLAIVGIFLRKDNFWWLAYWKALDRFRGNLPQPLVQALDSGSLECATPDQWRIVLLLACLREDHRWLDCFLSARQPVNDLGLLKTLLVLPCRSDGKPTANIGWFYCQAPVDELRLVVGHLARTGFDGSETKQLAEILLMRFDGVFAAEALDVDVLAYADATAIWRTGWSGITRTAPKFERIFRDICRCGKDYRLRQVMALLTNSEASEFDFAQRNKLLNDALLLALGAWPDESVVDWRFNRIKQLRLQVADIPDDLSHMEITKRLSALLEIAAKDCFDNFAAFERAFSNTHFDDPVEFEAWLLPRLPYLTLDVSSSDEGEIERRVTFMMNRLENGLDEDQRYLRVALGYLREC